MARDQILIERDTQLETIAKGTSGLVSLNTRISHEADECLNYIWALKQAEYNYIKYPKRVAVEYALRNTYLDMLREEQGSQHVSKPKSRKMDSEYYQNIIGGRR